MSNVLSISGLAKTISFLQLFLLAAIFGFFYAYACSAMWGLDLNPAKVAIEAMNGINTAVLNGVFAPTFFGPVPIGILSFIILWMAGARTSALWFAGAFIIYLAGAFLVTMNIAVPMNTKLLETAIPTDPQEALKIWSAYSETWQFWNWVRTGFSGLAFCSAAIGFYKLGGHYHAK